MAEINISNLGGGGGTLTLTTTGTGGASTYVAGVLNIPVYQSALTNPVTGTGTATRVAFWDSASSVSSSANLYWDNSNSFLGVGTATPGARLQVNGSGLTSGTTGLSVKDSGGTDNFTVADNGATFVRGVLTISGSSASNSATLMGRTSTGEVASVTLGTNLSFSGNTLNATGGGGTPAGSTGQVQFNNAGAFWASSNFNWDNTNSRLGVGVAAPGASLQINGAGATSGTSSLLINNSGASELFRIYNNGDINASPAFTFNRSLERLTLLGSSTNVNPIVISSGGATRAIINTNSALSPNTGFGLSYSNAIKWSIAAYGTNSDFTFYNDAISSSALFINGLTNNINIGATSESNYKLNVISNSSASSGAVKIRGSNTSSGTNAFLVENSTPSTLFQIQNNGATTLNGTLAQNGTVTMSDGSNIAVGSTNGTKIGTATTQKIGFYNATPIVRPDTGVAEAAFLEKAGGTAVNDDSTFGGYTLRQVVQALQNLGLLA